MQFSVPKTALEIIKNIKHIINSDVLITPEFATEENVKNIFGGSSAKIYDNRDYAKNVCAYGFPESIPLNAACITFSIVDGNGKIAEHGKIIGSAKASNFYDPNFTVDAVEELLGAPAHIEDRFSPLASPEPVKRKTHSLGLKKITYKFESDGATKIIVFETDGDGTVKAFCAVEEQK